MGTNAVFKVCMVNTTVCFIDALDSDMIFLVLLEQNFPLHMNKNILSGLRD